MATLLTPTKARPGDESLARGATETGNRSFQNDTDSINAPLCDEHGRLIVRVANGAGYTGPAMPPTGDSSVPTQSGSAPNVTNEGLVQLIRVMTRATVVAGAGFPYCGRLFGYAAAAGFVQLHLRDESAGDNPPVLTDVPEVSIAVGAGQNYTFGEYLLLQTGSNKDLATYLTFSTTGPTYTPGGVNAWYYFFGSR